MARRLPLARAVRVWTAAAGGAAGAAGAAAPASAAAVPVLRGRGRRPRGRQVDPRDDPSGGAGELERGRRGVAREAGQQRPEADLHGALLRRDAVGVERTRTPKSAVFYTSPDAPVAALSFCICRCCFLSFCSSAEFAFRYWRSRSLLCSWATRSALMANIRPR